MSNRTIDNVGTRHECSLRRRDTMRVGESTACVAGFVRPLAKPRRRNAIRVTRTAMVHRVVGVILG